MCDRVAMQALRRAFSAGGAGPLDVAALQIEQPDFDAALGDG